MVFASKIIKFHKPEVETRVTVHSATKQFYDLDQLIEAVLALVTSPKVCPFLM